MVYNQSPVITIIMDNRITGMTGHQENPGTGRTLQGKDAPAIEIEPLVRALGVQHVRTVPAFEVDEIEKTLKEYLKLDEPAVLITAGAVRAAAGRRASAGCRWRCIAEKCNGCTLCFRVGCPAILKSDELDAHYQRPQGRHRRRAVHRLRGLRPGLPARRHYLPPNRGRKGERQHDKDH